MARADGDQIIVAPEVPLVVRVTELAGPRVIVIAEPAIDIVEGVELDPKVTLALT